MNDFKTTFKADKDKYTLTQEDLFDKVINLKLYTEDSNGNLKDTYVIRSDYELYFPTLMDNVAKNDYNKFKTNNFCYIRKCQQKPAIKVQYKRISADAGVLVDIFVSNFHMLDKNGDLVTGFNNETYKLGRVDFAMGYFGQFKALFSNQLTTSGLSLITTGFADNADSAIGHGITVMSMSNVEYTQMDKLPPDSVLHIHGYVGNIFAPKFDTDTANFPKEYETLMKSQAVIPSGFKFGMETYLEKVYYETITRNWVKKGTPTELESTKVASGKEYTTGVMSDTDAMNYGIKVYLSSGAKAYSKEKEATFTKDADGNTIEPTIKIATANTAEGKMSAIENSLGLTGFTHIFMDTFGDYIVCLKEEYNDIEALLKNTTVEEKFKTTALAKTWDNCIPAVYNITNDALCTITCPFFCFINPFEKLYFKSRYSLGGLVSYFANFTTANRSEFYALWQNVSFATVEDINECTIVCTGQKK